ncbi:hypothetical protein FQN54_000175 [Arachnomyces sp. PD_36]|nr:hypothetical protein FQN54_000175 [Arachnomyces sp. PD_36]
MSSMRNAVQRRPHRERAQPAGREKWGILEKHKDYSLRARDYNAKKAKLQRLQEKARDRNPDEFAFGMMSDKSKRQGKHGQRDAESSRLSHEALKLLKTQDAGYLRVVGERTRRELEQLEKDVKLQEGMEDVVDKSSGRGKNGKVVFVDDKDEQRQIARNREAKEDDDEPEEVEVKGVQKKKSKKEIEAEKQAVIELRAARRLKKRADEVRRNKLEALQKRHEDILAAEQELGWQRARMSNSVGGVNKNGVKFKIRERKK